VLRLSFRRHVRPLLDVGDDAVSPSAHQMRIAIDENEHEAARVNMLLERRVALEIFKRDLRGGIEQVLNVHARVAHRLQQVFPGSERRDENPEQTFELEQRSRPG
jgi:DNA repair ATPase RecN